MKYNSLRTWITLKLKGNYHHIPLSISQLGWKDITMDIFGLVKSCCIQPLLGNAS
jgi:hypothetical protein